MDDITNTQNDSVGSLGARSGSWTNPGPDVVNPADNGRVPDIESDLNPLSIGGADFDDENDIDLTGSLAEDDANYSELGDEDDILPPDSTHPENSDDRNPQIVLDPMMSDDPADDAEDDIYAPVR